MRGYILWHEHLLAFWICRTVQGLGDGLRGLGGCVVLKSLQCSVFVDLLYLRIFEVLETDV